MTWPIINRHTHIPNKIWVNISIFLYFVNKCSIAHILFNNVLLVPAIYHFFFFIIICYVSKLPQGECHTLSYTGLLWYNVTCSTLVLQWVDVVKCNMSELQVYSQLLCNKVYMQKPHHWFDSYSGVNGRFAKGWIEQRIGLLLMGNLHNLHNHQFTMQPSLDFTIAYVLLFIFLCIQYMSYSL